MIDWDDAIIKSLKDLGGKATNQQIYEKIKDYVALDKDLLKAAFGSIRYHSIIRSHLNALKKNGIISSPREGIHELTKLK
jgi:DNA-binding transcriptional ArsR family regulator